MARMPTHFKPTEGTLDTALRYWAVLNLLKSRWHGDAKVLEVGSGSGGVTEWLDHPVVGVDTAFERTAERATDWLEPRVGRATALPVESGHFDFVLSLEMLEHLPWEERTGALQEMVRALAPGGRMVVTFPSDRTGERLDQWLNTEFEKVHGIPHPWVSEHIAAGLPRSVTVKAEAEAIAGPGATVKVRRHLGATGFKIVHGLYTVRRREPLTRRLGLHSERAVGVIFRVLRTRPPSRRRAYRAILVVDKPQRSA
jgi:SAM-dependent methyltransferase